MFIFTSGGPRVEYSRSPNKAAGPGATDIIFQSIDGGQTWQDISHTLPESVQPQDFFAGESDIYARIENVLYRSKSNLKTPVWEKENLPDLQDASIAFNRYGVVAYNYDAKMYQKNNASETWMPVYASFKKQTMRTIFESADGTVFIGSDNGLFKSTDKGKTWKQVQNEGWTMDIVESEGVLLATGQKGIMRSTDKGEHWEWVISEGGVGIAVERIQGGFAAISYNSSAQSRKIRLSSDGGKTWKTIGEGLRPSLSISSIKQVGYNLLCAHPDGVFLSSDSGRTWKRVLSGVSKNMFASGQLFSINPPNEDSKVFKLYTSGNVVYAVIRNYGC